MTTRKTPPRKRSRPSTLSTPSEPEGEPRTKEDGKTSSVHFVRFRFTPAQIAEFRKPGARVLIGIDHPNYGHIAVVSETGRAALAADFE